MFGNGHSQFVTSNVVPPEAGTTLELCRAPAQHRHCEELLRRSNPDCLRGKILDCFAALAM